MLTRHLLRTWANFAKICKTPQEAVEGIQDGSFLLVGGFGLSGIPMNLINAVKES
jgi:acyl CoA:acetate/3-ketoacid CoA transferase alpha subunit